MPKENNKGQLNPNWKGGPISKTCVICSKVYVVKRPQAKSRFCSLQCVGVSQRGVGKTRTSVQKICVVCSKTYTVYKSHKDRHHCCSMTCSYQRRSWITKDDKNPNWAGGVSRRPYPHHFYRVSRQVIARDGYQCKNPLCRLNDRRLTTHHINYDKDDLRQENLICLCSSCNSRANFGRERWIEFYMDLMSGRNFDDCHGQ